MPESDLDAELRRRAERDVESILSEARAEAEGLLSQADERIEARRREVLTDKEADYGAEARTAIAAERHAAMRTVLLARTRMVDRVIERARSLLPEAAKSEVYLSALAGDLVEALRFVEGDHTVVRCSEGLAPAITEALHGRPEVTVEPASGMDVGFVVAGGEGSVVVDGRLETRIDRLSSTLAIEIQRQLEDP